MGTKLASLGLKVALDEVRATPTNCFKVPYIDEHLSFSKFFACANILILLNFSSTLSLIHFPLELLFHTFLGGRVGG